jgi:vacuolar-type H+-ATPase subunit I/STV1
MTGLQDLNGVGDSRAENLTEAGYESVDDLADAEPEEIAESVNYLPEDTALELVVQSQNMVEERDAEVTEEEPTTITEEIEEAQSEDEEDEELEEELEELEEEIDEEESEPEEIEFELSFDESLEFDTLFDSLMNQRATMLQTNRDGIEPFDHALDQMRDGGMDEPIALTMEPDQINELHSCVRQRITSYKGNNLIDHMDALKSVMTQINEVRDEHLF